MVKKSVAREGRITAISGAMQIGLWVLVLVFAFCMQVVPFLLVLTMLNLAVGITSGVALIVIPAAAFGMLSVACWIATKRTRNMLPDPLPQPGYVAPYGDGDRDAQTVHQRLIPLLQRWRWRFF